MDEYERLKPLEMECKYHVFSFRVPQEGVVQMPRQHLGEVFKQLAEQRESRIEQGIFKADHVHMMISIPPKYAVSQVVGSSRARARSTWRGVRERKQNYAGQSFWARGYFVSTVGA